jgi:hypothetical protein
MNLLALAFLLVVWPGAHVLACGIRLSPEVLSSSGRLAGIAIDLRHAATGSLLSAPAGWRVTTDNDPSWNTRLTGHAVVGAAFLSIRALEQMMTILPENQGLRAPTCSVSARSMSG